MNKTTVGFYELRGVRASYTCFVYLDPVGDAVRDLKKEVKEFAGNVRTTQAEYKLTDTTNPVVDDAIAHAIDFAFDENLVERIRVKRDKRQSQFPKQYFDPLTHLLNASLALMLALPPAQKYIVVARAGGERGQKGNESVVSVHLQEYQKYADEVTTELATINNQ